MTGIAQGVKLNVAMAIESWLPHRGTEPDLVAPLSLELNPVTSAFTSTHPSRRSSRPELTHENRTQFYCKIVPYKPYLIFIRSHNSQTDKQATFFSFRVAPRCSACSDRFPPYTATRTEAARLVTVPYHSARLALGASDTRIRFFFSRTLRRGRSKYVERKLYQKAASTCFFIIISSPHNYSTPLSEENIYQTTRPSEVARLT